VQAAQSHSPQGTGGGPSMGAMRSGLEAASWIPGPIGTVAAATLVGIDIYQGNYGQAALGVVGIFGGRVATSGVRAMRDTKIVAAAVGGLSDAGAKIGNAFAGWAKGASRGGGNLLNPGINLTEKGMGHTIARHTHSEIAEFAGKSKFNAGEDIGQLIRSGTQMPMVRQGNGNYARTFNVGRSVGIDRGTGGQTSMMTIITNARGDLVTAFPGVPR